MPARAAVRRDGLDRYLQRRLRCRPAGAGDPTAAACPPAEGPDPAAELTRLLAEVADSIVGPPRGEPAQPAGPAAPRRRRKRTP